MKGKIQRGMHVVSVFELDGEFVVSVDGMLLRASFGSTAEAWDAGIAEVDRADRGPRLIPTRTARRTPAARRGEDALG